MMAEIETSSSVNIELNESECKSILQEVFNTNTVHYIKHKIVPRTPNGFNGLYFTANITFGGTNSGELSCFIKTVPRNDRHYQYIKGAKLLMKEYEIYKTIIPAMQSSLKCDIPVPRHYLVRDTPETPFQNILVMEDLEMKGFSISDRCEAMDWAHCSLTMQALAKLHAGSLVLLERRGHSVLELCHFPDEGLFVSDPSHPAYLWARSCTDTLLYVAERHPRFNTRLFSEDMVTKFLEVWRSSVDLVKASGHHINVICHGDIWSNNIMFKYHQGKPTDVVIIDLQVYRYAPPVIDVLMFLHLNTTRDFREKHKEELLQVYQEALQTAVEESGCTLPTSLSMQGVKQLAEEYLPFGLIAASGYVPMSQRPPAAWEDVTTVNTDPEDSDGKWNYDVLKDFLSSRGEQVWKAMQRDERFQQRVVDVMDELLVYIGL